MIFFSACVFQNHEPISMVEHGILDSMLNLCCQAIATLTWLQNQPSLTHFCVKSCAFAFTRGAWIPLTFNLQCAISCRLFSSKDQPCLNFASKLHASRVNTHPPDTGGEIFVVATRRQKVSANKGVTCVYLQQLPIQEWEQRRSMGNNGLFIGVCSGSQTTVQRHQQTPI